MIFTFKKGGIHPPENKFTSDKEIKNSILPKKAFIPLSQHIGAPSKALVAKGDEIKVGQLLAESTGFISANIHSSVSGKVFKIDKIPNLAGVRTPHIIINVNGDEWLDTIDKTDKLITEISIPKEEIAGKIKDYGIVGLGGATFPTNVKLMPPKGSTCEVLIINGVECEPYLTADERLMLEKTEEIFVGIEILKKSLGVNKAIIGIEKNKPEAIEKMQQVANRYEGTEVYPLTVKYPQGAEKQLISAATGKEVASGKLPISVGAVVQNVGTVFAVYEAIQKNKPLFERVVTVTGKKLSDGANLLTRIGTPISELIDQCGGVPEMTGKIINGGPMMGKAISSTASPIIKGSSGILLMDIEESSRKETENCIRCSRCVSVCPMGLEPFLLMAYSENKMADELKDNAILDCMECGSCSYTCPSNRDLLDYIRLGKVLLRKQL